MNEMLCDGQTSMLATLDNFLSCFGVYRHHVSREINHTEDLRKVRSFLRGYHTLITEKLHACE